MIIPPIGVGPLGPSEWSVGSVPGVAGLGSGAPGQTSGGGTGSGSFAGALTNAISSLDTSQSAASTAATQLADGQASNPTQVVTTVENAALSMDYAAQIRNQLDTAAQTLFATQM
ncbi:flagellar hook-basal body complex protein FliE [Conexibacter sp. DBS9H8]|uniref:flagellar hook-basal body complex protein FliE n=1 Tax=Conexibacter sp. DBS9H8 TaxID=2937801 RepID=UPI0020100AA4|nr:flagellar hook-basal body complex protein FliE [Conexibacter sp. DBS9H8]